MDKISIIIPVYNSEKHLYKCLDSVIKQTYSNLEIICINDGSTDGSKEILEEYYKKDNRIVIINSENFGAAAARNRGLNIASGKYIGFVDSDDWIENDFYEVLYNNIIKYNADISSCSYYIDTSESSILSANKEVIPHSAFGREDALRYCFMRDTYKGYSAYLPLRLFKADIFIKHNIRFREDLKISEDVVMFTELTLNSKSITYTPDSYYHYFQNNNSLTHSENINIREDGLKGYLIVIELLTENNIPVDIINYVKRFYVYWASIFAEMAYKQNNKIKLINYQNSVKLFLNEYLSTNSEYPNRIERIYSILSY